MSDKNLLADPGKTYTYDPDFIRNKVIFTKEEKSELKDVALSCAGANFFKNQGFLNRFEYEFALTTARIEGSTISAQDVKSIITDGTFSEPGYVNDVIMVSNLAEAYRYIANNDLDVSLHTAQELHELLADKIVKDKRAVGGMKVVNNEVVGGIHYVPLEPTGMLKAEMQVLFQTYNELEDPFDRALYIHNNIAYMQYFADCNKRTARAMQLVSMKKDGVSPLILIDKNSPSLSNDYSKSLIEYYADGTYTSSKQFFITNYRRIGLEISNSLAQKDVQQALSEGDAYVIAKGSNQKTNNILEQISTVSGPPLRRFYVVRKENLAKQNLDLRGYAVFDGMRDFLKMRPLSETELTERFTLDKSEHEVNTNHVKHGGR